MRILFLTSFHVARDEGVPPASERMPISLALVSTAAGALDLAEGADR